MIRVVRAAGAAGMAVALMLAPLASRVPSAAAVTPSVTIVTHTTYDLLPTENRVAVTVGITVTSHLQDTVTRHYYTDRAYLAVVPTGSKFHLAAASGSPSVAVSSRSAGGTVLLLRFGSQLGAGQSLALTLTFQIADPGGAPDRPLRISPSLVSFQAWAYGTDGVAGSTVRVRLPAEYAVAVGRGPLAGPTTEPDGHLAFDSGTLATPATFVADIQADRPGDLVATDRSVVVLGTSVTLLSRSWPDDPAWRARIADLLVPGLPALANEIGLAWPLGSQLEIRETLPQLAGGNSSSVGDAAALDPGASRLDVAYVANPSSIIHGAAHVWFNGNLVADQWIADGFAALYAGRVGKVIGVAVASPAMTAAAFSHALPLNAWVPGGTADDFGEAAAVALARAIAEQAGDTALRGVWADAANGVGAYQPVTGSTAGAGATAAAGAPEVASGPPDWRALLDLLEARSSGSFDGLWRRWVVRPSDVALLDVRAAARRHYDDVVQAGGTWLLPRSIRDAMRAWQFETANQELDAASGVLRQRDQVVSAAAHAGLAPPSRLRVAFEGGDGLSTAAAEAVTELAVITTYVEASKTRPVNLDIATRIGLLGTTPDADLAAAAAAFASGDLDGTLHLAAAAKATWLATPDVARGRIIGAALLGIAIVLLVWLLVGSRRKRPKGTA